ncbi:hypothetical protein [Christiangramia sabulilitoris]|uniref:Oligosaccharide repeat unit polymerase n=1 Tax=Christiangramia sabulilitoris TaxID=2583991 RepID=A0A550HZV5_9FLAO|nr:hypothetical protein [Christiangramia sabulilitoris]TRO64272.1 hypothetical protein FGM01_12310 [Christiangramia sabulilitoris]
MNLSLTPQKYWLLKFVIWISYFVYAIIALTTLENFELKTGVLLCGVLIELSLIVFVNNWYRLKTPKLLDWFRLGTFLTLILNFFSLAFFLDSEGSILVNNTKLVSSDNALVLLFIVLIGLLGLKFGQLFIESFPSKKKYSKEIFYKVKRLNLIYLLTISISIIQVYLMLNGFIGYGSDKSHNISQYSFLLQAIQIMVPFFLVLLSVLKFFFKSSGVFFNSIFISFLLVQFIVGFLSGMKENILTPIILIAVPYIFSGRKIPKVSFLIIIVGVFIIYPINNNYRDILNNSKLNKNQALNLAIVSTFNDSTTELISSGSESYSNRLSLLPMAMYSVQIEQSWNEYKYLDRYLLIPIAWIIPRGLLPQKPASDTGSKLYKTITGGTNNSVTPSTFGWAYLEGGYIPVFLTFLFLGLFVTMIQTHLNIHSIFGLIIYSLLLSELLKIEADIYFRISGMLQVLLISYFLYKIFITHHNSLQNLKT